MLYKSALFCFLSIFLLAGTLSAQFFPELLWHRFYGSPSDDTPHRLLLSRKGEIYMAGTYGVSDPDSCARGAIIKAALSEKGTELWHYLLPEDDCSEVRGLVLVENDEVLAYAGSTLVPPLQAKSEGIPPTSHYMLGKLNRDGGLVWQKSFGGSKPDRGYALAGADNGGFLLTGSAWSKDYDVPTACASLNNQWVLLLNSFAQQRHNFCVGGAKNDWGVDALHTQDGGHLLLGYTTSEDLDGSKIRVNGDAWLVKLDKDGQIQWQRVIKEPYEDILNRVVQTKYGVYAAVGSAFHAQKAKQNWFVKFDETGRISTDKKWGGKGFEELTGIAALSDGGFIVTGWSYYYQLENRYIKGQRDLWVIRLDPDGDIIWQQTYGGPDNEEGVDVVEYAPHHFLVLGKKRNTFSEEGTDRGDDFWLLAIKERPCADMQVYFETNNRKNKLALGEQIRFVNKSQNLERWKWDFGDGNTSTEHSPLYKYQRPGEYTVRLTGYNNEGCQRTYLHPSMITVK